MFFQVHFRNIHTTYASTITNNPKKTLATNYTVLQTNIFPLPMLAQYFSCLFGYNINRERCPPYLTTLVTLTQSKRSLGKKYKLPSSPVHNKPNLNTLKYFSSLPDPLHLARPHSIKAKLKAHFTKLIT